MRASAVNGYCRLGKWETSETEEKIVEQDQRATGTGTEGAAGSFDSAVNALSMNTLNATSKNLRAIAGEILEISKQSFELTTKTLEKLRTTHGVDEVAAIQAEGFRTCGARAKVWRTRRGLPGGNHKDLSRGVAQIGECRDESNGKGKLNRGRKRRLCSDVERFRAL